MFFRKREKETENDMGQIEELGTLAYQIAIKRDELGALNAQINEAVAKLADIEEQYKSVPNAAAEQLAHWQSMAQQAEKQYKIRLQEQESYLNGMLDKRSRAMASTEMKCWAYIKRIEKREQDVYDELLKRAEKFNKFSNMEITDGFAFEGYVADILSKNGFVNVEVTSKSHDWGTDVIAEKDGLKYLFQCKYYTKPVGVAAVQEVYTSMMHYKAHVAAVVTNSVFTSAAQILADETRVLLYDGEWLNTMQKKAENSR